MAVGRADHHADGAGLGQAASELEAVARGSPPAVLLLVCVQGAFGAFTVTLQAAAQSSWSRT
ncbi:hypothetical protein ACU4GD_46070 [Cupriavidus basilensis]